MNLVKAFGLLTLSITLFRSVTRYFSKKQQQHFKELHFKVLLEEEGEEEEVQVWSSWAELEWNILGEIVNRLCVTDQARFRAVCKNWLAAPQPTKSPSSLPWHGCKAPDNGDEYQIYDPLSSPNHLASRHFIKGSELVTGIPYTKTTLLSVLNVKHNWVFISFMKTKLFFWTRRCVTLFSPFTRRIITLPTFDYPRWFHFSATFSTHPDSPDCVFCMVHTKQVNRKIVVLTYHNGDKEWTARQFNAHPDFKPREFTIPHIIGGILYILNHYGQVASYNILNGHLNFDRLLPDEFVLYNSGKRLMFSFVLNGELMIICFTRNVKNDATLPGQDFVRRYDRSLKVWIPVRTLADNALFVSSNLNNISIINTKDMTCNRVLSNKVYHFFDGGCVVYSVEDGELVKFKKTINSNLLEDGADDLPEYKYNYATPDAFFAYWLDAPRVHSSDNEEVYSYRDEGKQDTVRALG